MTSKKNEENILPFMPLSISVEFSLLKVEKNNINLCIHLHFKKILYNLYRDLLTKKYLS